MCCLPLCRVRLLDAVRNSLPGSKFSGNSHLWFFFIELRTTNFQLPGCDGLLAVVVGAINIFLDEERETILRVLHFQLFTRVIFYLHGWKKLQDPGVPFTPYDGE
jgi:hypothetical protein